MIISGANNPFLMITEGEKSKTFLESIPTIIIFLSISLATTMFFGENALFWFLCVLLLGMLVLNSSKVNEKIQILTGKGSVIK